MSRYVMIRRLRGPVFLLLVGVLALLAQANILPWRRSWPLFLILFGVIMLAERAALAAEDDNSPLSSPADPSADTGIPPYPGKPTAHLPSATEDYVDPFERKS